MEGSTRAQLSLHTHNRKFQYRYCHRQHIGQFNISCSTVTFFIVIRNKTKFVPNSFSQSYQKFPTIASSSQISFACTCQFGNFIKSCSSTTSSHCRTACSILGCTNRFALIILSIIVKKS